MFLQGELSLYAQGCSRTREGDSAVKGLCGYSRFRFNSIQGYLEFLCILRALFYKTITKAKKAPGVVRMLKEGACRGLLLLPQSRPPGLICK